MSQCFLRARRSSNSARARSVPWRRSTKGETTARRKSPHPRVIGLGKGRRGGVLCRERDGRQPEQDPQEKPKIGVQYKILVGLQSIKGQGKQEESRVPEEDKGKGKRGRALELLHDPPSEYQNREAHDEPKDKSAYPHLKNNAAEAAFHARSRRLRVKDPRNILDTERGRADAVAIRPSFISERAEEIPNRIVPGAMLECAGSAAGRERFAVDRHA